MIEGVDTGIVREFATGATRDTGQGKLEIHRFISPRVIRRFCEYMNKHREQSDGSLRAPDNWKKGIPYHVYLSSLVRHLWDLLEEGEKQWGGEDLEPMPQEEMEDTICAILFNAQGLLFELTREG